MAPAYREDMTSTNQHVELDPAAARTAERVIEALAGPGTTLRDDQLRAVLDLVVVAREAPCVCRV